MPCHNGEKYVAESIDSVLAQTWPHLEVVIVDDASTDQSLRVAERYLSKGVCVISEDFGSAAKARNRAMQEAQGDYIKFLDCDDLLNPEAIEAQIHSLQGSTRSISFSAWGRFYGDDPRSFRLNACSEWRSMKSFDWLVEAWRDAQPMTQPGMYLIPRELLQRSGGWDENLSLIDDFEFFARVLCHAEDVRFTPGARLYYRSGIAGSLSSRKTRSAAESAFHSIMKGTGHLLARRSDSEARLSCANVMQNFLYTFYPEHPDLRIVMSAQIAELGGSDLPPPGGPWFQRARRLIGWKAARRLQRATGRF